MRKKMLVCLSLALSLMLPQFAFALHPELSIPEKVENKHKACQEIMRLGNKYKVEGLFSKEFEEGKAICTRIDVAAAVRLLTEKMAEKVVKEGAGAIDKEDLVLLSDLKEELRAEMLLVGTRTFQSRYEELGTRFTALTRNISLSGGLVGVLQGSINNDPQDQVDVVGRGDLVFNFKVGESTIAVIDVEATGGDGIDASVGNFSVLNGVAGTTNDTVRFREAWVEHVALNDRLVMTAGKVDLTNYFDSNAVANDENGQFLAGAFVHSAVLGIPGNGPGVRLEAKLAEPLTFGIGYGSGDSDSADVFDHGFGIAELGYKLKVGELEGNYRIYGSVDSTLPVLDPDTSLPAGDKLTQKDAFGFGVSLDQQVTDKLTLFARYGQRDEDVFVTKMAWSAGGQYVGLIPDRKDDVLGFAFGQIQAVGAGSQEKLAEVYYKVKVNDQIEIAPIAQYLINPLGDSSKDDVVALGLRSQISF